MICAVDLGGTKTILGLFKQQGGKRVPVRESTFPSREFPSFASIVKAFLSEGREKVDTLSVGVAGPVDGGRSQVVNLRWPVDARQLRRQLDLAQVHLLNDVEATGWGIPELAPKQLIRLTPGLRGSAAGHAALIAPGTGLGMAILGWDGKHRLIIPSEGGHQDFAPRDDLEIALLRFLRRRHGRVSIERVTSGPAFTDLYQFLTENGWGKESAEMSRRLVGAADANAVISQAGVAGEDPVAVKAVEMFVSILGAVAGDLALVTRAVGGLYIGGGIAPKILPKLRSASFLQAFRGKGRLTPLLEKIPVRVLLEPRTALLGAAAYAAHFNVSNRKLAPKRVKGK